MTLELYKKICILTTFILIFLLGILWNHVYTNHTQRLNEPPALTSKDEINAALHNIDIRDMYQIPTGVYIDTFEIKSVNQLTIAGRIWQSYPKNFPLETGVHFNKATGTKLTLINKESIGDKVLYLWHFETNIYEKIIVDKYPFDHQISKIEIVPADSEKNIILIPDLEAYAHTDPRSNIGIGDYDLSNYGFYITESYFNYQHRLIATNWGNASIKKHSSENVLTYNIILKRQILDAVLIYFLPFMVILSLLFAVLIIVQKWLERSLTSVTALIFTLFILHRMLRDTFIVSQVLYLEYMFITGYLALFFIGFYIVFIFFHQQLKSPNSKRHMVIVHSFWPIILLSWIFISIKVLF